jgi:hypothetical protein
MSQVKNNKNPVARIAGGALVVLSGFVPMPHVLPSGTLAPGSARAAKITIPVTGKFITGITLSNKAALKFGKFVATKATGNFAIKLTADAATAGADAKVVTAPVRGKFGIKVAVDAPVDVMVSKIGTDLTLNSIAGQKQGDITLSKINFVGAFKAGVNVTVATAGGTTAKQSNVTIKFAQIKKTGGTDNVATFAAGLKWAGNRPIGSISNSNGGSIVLTVIY